jgi:hypothetical protein
MFIISLLLVLMNFAELFAFFNYSLTLKDSQEKLINNSNDKMSFKKKIKDYLSKEIKDLVQIEMEKLTGVIII